MLPGVSLETATEVAFKLDSFVREGDVFVLEGRWCASPPRMLGRPKLAVVGEGKRRRLAPGARSPVEAAPQGVAWRGRFRWPGAPDEIESAELEIGAELVELPLPAARDGAAVAVGRFARQEAAPTPALLDEMKTLLEALRSEREAITTEREALEAVARAVADRPAGAVVRPPAVAIKRREHVDLGYWPQILMAVGLTAFAVLVVLIASS